MKTIKQLLFGFIALCLLPFISLGQYTPHQLNTERELGLLGGGAAGMVLSIPFGKKVKPLTEEEIRALDPAQISKFDMYSTKHYGKSAQKLSDKLLYSSAIAPLSLIASDRLRDEIGTYGVMYLETVLINTAITTLTKNLVKRTRPYAYNPSVELIKKKEKDTRLSFFSGHTSTTSAMYFFTAQVYDDLHPDSDFKPFVWTTAALIPAITGYLRAKGGKHFPTDVLVGYVVGGLVGIFIPRLHRSVL